LASGLEEALLTGGEPLVSSDLWPIAERLKRGGARLMLATNGMQLERFASRLVELFDEVYVSLDGGKAITHDRLRGVPAFVRLRAGLAALQEASPRPKLVARSVLHRGNLDELEATILSAGSLGFDHLSFLPLDASSAAFGGQPRARAGLVPAPEQVEGFRAAIARLDAAGKLGDGFVLESAAKLLRIADHLRASGGDGAFVRPECDAPWVVLGRGSGRTGPPLLLPRAGGRRARGARAPPCVRSVWLGASACPRPERHVRALRVPEAPGLRRPPKAHRMRRARP
jgi:hypothetical protein